MIGKLFSFFLELDLDLTEVEDDFHDAFKLSGTAKTLIIVGCAAAAVAIATIVIIAIVKRKKKNKANKNEPKSKDTAKTGK